MSLSRAPGRWEWQQHPTTGGWYRVNVDLNIWDGPYDPPDSETPIVEVDFVSALDPEDVARDKAEQRREDIAR